MWHGGKLLALEETHLPTAISHHSLDTIRYQDYGKAISGPFTAHPKIDPKTGELVFFGYSANGPFSPLTSYGTISESGNVTRVEHFEAPYSSMVHGRNTLLYGGFTMNFGSLLSLYGTGFTLDRLEELRKDSVGMTVTKNQRKQLAALIEESSTRGRVGRIVNYILIGVVTDQAYWLDWLRHSTALRPSGHDLNTATLEKLLPLLSRMSGELALPTSFEDFLENLRWLVALASAAYKKRIALIKLIAKDDLLVKSCLVTTDLLFIGRTEGTVREDVELHPEDAAMALSYLIYLVQKKRGPDAISLQGIDTKKIMQGYYLGILEAVKDITDYFNWEHLVCYFGYSCRLSDDHSALLIESPSPAFAKSMRGGFYPPGDAKPCLSPAA